MAFINYLDLCVFLVVTLHIVNLYSCILLYVALLEELGSYDFHCHFYTVAYVHMTLKPLNLES